LLTGATINPLINMKFMITYNFNGKTAIITGGAKGIGLETAIQFASSGANVSILSKTYYKELELKFKGFRNKIKFYTIDVTNEKAIKESIADTIRNFGGIDILINNASISKAGLVDQIDLKDWELVMNTNVKSYFMCIKAVLSNMKLNKYGKIINVSSIAGRDKSILLGAAYTTSKAAVIGLTRHLATELGDIGINVNCICPSQTYTPMLKNIFSEKNGFEELVKKRNPLGYIASPKQIADIILFLSSDESNYMNGAIVDVNGGVL